VPVVVTLSAVFGAGGSVVGPAVAEQLGVPFVDRAIPVTVAETCGVSVETALAYDGRAEHGIGKLLAAAARVPNVTLGGLESWLPEAGVVPEEELVRQTEAVISEVAQTTGGVILGRAGALVLADRPGVLHVRLTGPEEARLRLAMERGGLTEEVARRRLRENDRAREAYVRHFYRADPADPQHYHVVIDSTVLPLDAVTDVIARAARAVSSAS
jgi:cytidylate kinase